MGTNTSLRQRQRKPLGSFVAVATAAAAAALMLALAGTPAVASANEAAAPAAAGAAARVVELERQFWICDHAATRTMLDFATAARCSATTEELRKLRFGDDFNAMLAWWRERKASEHAALDAAAEASERAAPVRGPAATSTVTPPTAPGPAASPAPSVPSPPPGPLDAASPEQLKAAYLHCDRLATTEHFDRSTVIACSIVYEALKARVFGGSTERLIAWRQQQLAAADRGAASAHP